MREVNLTPPPRKQNGFGSNALVKFFSARSSSGSTHWPELRT